jgi:hypothetical protein
MNSSGIIYVVLRWTYVSASGPAQASQTSGIGTQPTDRMRRYCIAVMQWRDNLTSLFLRWRLLCSPRIESRYQPSSLEFYCNCDELCSIETRCYYRLLSLYPRRYGFFLWSPGIESRCKPPRLCFRLTNFLRSRLLRNYSISKHFMDPEGSLPCSQEPCTISYPVF